MVSIVASMTGHVAERPTDFSTALQVFFIFIAFSLCSLSTQRLSARRTAGNCRWVQLRIAASFTPTSFRRFRENLRERRMQASMGRGYS
jgi:hypothetical protein